MYLVVWDNRSDLPGDIVGVRIDANGVVLDPSPIVIARTEEGELEPDVASNGQVFLVAWHYRNPLTGGSIRAARVDPTGLVLDPVAIEMPQTAGFMHSPTVASTEDDFLVGWTGRTDFDHRDVSAARVSGTGVVLDPLGLPVASKPHAESLPAAAGRDGTYLVVWEAANSGIRMADIEGRQVDASNGGLHPRSVVSLTPNQQQEPSVAWSGRSYLAVWRDARGKRRGIYGARISRSGRMLDGTGFKISPSNRHAGGPSVAWNGHRFLVVWSSPASDRAERRLRGGDDIYGARVTSSGRLLDRRPIPISTARKTQELPAVAPAKRGFVVVWVDWRNSTPDYYDYDSENTDLFATRITTAGRVLDPGGIGVATGPRNAENPAVAWDGANHLIVWQHDCLYDAKRSCVNGIFGRRMNPAGKVLDRAAIRIADDDWYQNNPAVAWGGGSYLVSWTDNKISGDANIAGAWVSRSGALSGPRFALSRAKNHQYGSAVAWDGTRFLAIWTDCRRSKRSFCYVESPPDVFGRWLRPLARWTASGFAVSTTPAIEYLGSLGRGPRGTTMIVYQHEGRDISFGIPVALRRLIK